MSGRTIYYWKSLVPSEEAEVMLSVKEDGLRFWIQCMVSTGGSEVLAAGHGPEAPVACDFPSACLCCATSSLSTLGGTRNIKNQGHVSRLEGECNLQDLPPWESEVLSVHLFIVLMQWMKKTHYSRRKPQAMVGLGAGEDVREKTLRKVWLLPL